MPPADSAPMIATRGLSKRFGGVMAVDSLSLEVGRGEVVGLLGPNGAGKTTTIRMLACLIGPSSGEAQVCGLEVGRDDAAIRSRIGLLTEVPGLWEGLSAEQNLTIYGRLHGLADVGMNVAKYLSMLGLWERRRGPAGTFSKGMKQKLALARALVHEPQLLFLDEPTSGLDPKMTRTVREFIAELRDEGRTIVLCTHNLAEAERLCDRIAVVRTTLVALDRTDALRARLFGRSTEVRLRRLEPGLLESVRSLRFVTCVRADDTTLIVDLEDPEADNPALVKNLVEAGAEVVSVGERERTLEEIYLTLVREPEDDP
jgi:ABC-2 type transport system ATP-binding protein